MEKQMMDGEFEADALDGLQEFKNKKDISSLVNQLNADLKRRTEKKKRFKEKMKLNLDFNLIIAIVILLLLIVLSYFIIHKMVSHS